MGLICNAMERRNRARNQINLSQKNGPSKSTSHGVVTHESYTIDSENETTPQMKNVTPAESNS